ncbi:MAG: hypothetical protein M0Z69_06935 [Actinomycetota bacterium]|nr:hypothetical protein [Actinomycetota bacterium]
MSKGGRERRYEPIRNTSVPTDISLVDGAPSEAPRFRDQHLAYDENGTNLAMERFLAEYVPNFAPAKMTIWVAVVRVVVLQLVRQLQLPTVHLAREATRKLAEIYVDTFKRLGTLDVNVVLSLDNVYYFVDVVNGDQSSYWRKKARADLIRYAKALTATVVFPPQPLRVPRNRALPPYPTAVEMACLEHARSLTGPLAGRRMTVVALGFGAGLAGVICCTFTPEHFVDLGHGVLGVRVDGPDPRIVPIRGRYRDLVEEAIALADGGPLIGKVGADSEAISTALNAFQSLSAERITVPRLRATWFVRLLDAGVPVQWALHWCGERSRRYMSDLVAYSRRPDKGPALDLVRMS